MVLEATHILLVSGRDFAECCRRVSLFFDKNFLVRYDRVEVVEEKSCSAENNGFWKLAEEKIDANHRAVAWLVKELQDSGFLEISDLNRMGQGYESKVLHLITHLVDGFFGADTVFYNLEEDSHWLSDGFALKIKEQPEKYWLMYVECSATSVTDRLEKIRKFEVKPGG